MTEAEFAAIKEREKAATKGPWGFSEFSDRWDFFCVDPYDIPSARSFDLFRCPTEWTPSRENAQFIVYARRDIPMLIDEINVLTGHLHDMQNESQMYEFGKSEAYANVLKLLRKQRWEMEKAHDEDVFNSDKYHCDLGHIQASNHFIDAVLEMSGCQPGKSPDLIPPVEARAEVERLREALRKVKEMVLLPYTYDGIEVAKVVDKALVNPS